MYKTNGIKAMAFRSSLLNTSKSCRLPLTILLDAVLVDTGDFCPSVKVIVILWRRWGRGGIYT